MSCSRVVVPLVAVALWCGARAARNIAWEPVLDAARVEMAAARQRGLAASPLNCLPLLPPGTHFGASYSPPSSPAAKNATDAVYGTLMANGARLIQISLPWNAVETAPGVYNFDMVAELLFEVRQVGGFPLVNLAAIDTDRVSAPADLVDPVNPDRLANNMTWTSPLVLDRYAQVMHVFAPLVAFYSGFYIGLGNEVDATLLNDPQQAASFPTFAYVMAQYVRNLTVPDMAVGATLTVGGLGSMARSPPQWLSDLLLVADATPLTYYPLNADFTVRTSKAAIQSDVNAALAALPARSCVVFQELGAPSGYNNASSTDKSSDALQASMYGSLLQVVSAVNASGNAVRAVSAFQLVDMDAATCNSFVPYYNVTIPAFLEYLCTLGMMRNNGTAKPALQVFLDAIAPAAA